MMRSFALLCVVLASLASVPRHSYAEDNRSGVTCITWVQGSVEAYPLYMPEDYAAPVAQVQMLVSGPGAYALYMPEGFAVRLDCSKGHPDVQLAGTLQAPGHGVVACEPFTFGTGCGESK